MSDRLFEEQARDALEAAIRDAYRGGPALLGAMVTLLRDHSRAAWERGWVARKSGYAISQNPFGETAPNNSEGRPR